MSVSPIITFKAGKCDVDRTVIPARIRPIATPGFLYLYHEDELIHFCWRPRSASLADVELDLTLPPADTTFKPYLGPDKTPNKSPVNGRIFTLKFLSSTERHFFWLQSREQPRGQPNKFSQRDLRLGQFVDDLLQGNEIDTNSQIASLRNQDSSNGDDDTTMDDAPSDLYRSASGGAGADATGGDVREEGEEARDGGADGGRANLSMSHQASTVVQNFLDSLKGHQIQGQGQAHFGTQQQDVSFTSLAELLPSSSTIPMVEAAEPSSIEDLLVQHLPSSLVFLEHEVDDTGDEADAETVRASAQALEPEQQKGIVKRVLRSPQFSQGLMTLTQALRDGGLPMISATLGISVENGGYTGPDRHIPLSGGAAVEAFLEGVKDSVQQDPASPSQVTPK